MYNIYWHGPQPKEIKFYQMKETNISELGFFKILIIIYHFSLMLYIEKYVYHENLEETWNQPPSFMKYSYNHPLVLSISRMHGWSVGLKIAPISVLTTFTRLGEASLHTISSKIQWLNEYRFIYNKIIDK